MASGDELLKNYSHIALSGTTETTVAAGHTYTLLSVTWNEQAGAAETFALYIDTLAPTSGKQLRLISYIMDWDDANLSTCSIYFGTGAGIVSDITKAIGEFTLEVDINATAQQVFPDGAGPIGIVDDVLSVRNVNATGDNTITITYREE